MAVTQYIGARYVPLFADPIEWNINTTYEPLTIVTYQGNSYTSRQSVPTGIDILNETYWALTSNYNAQIEAYRNEVSEISKKTESYETEIAKNADDIVKNIEDIAKNASAIEDNNIAQTAALNAVKTDLEEKVTAEQNARIAGDNAIDAKIGIVANREFSSIVTIGDSWLEGYSSIGNFTSWGQLLRNFYNPSSYIEKYKGGCGFLVENGGVSFNTLVGNARADSQDPSSVELVVIAGGINDRKEDYESLKSSAESVIQNASDSFPNAEIWVFPMMLAGRFLCNRTINRQKAIIDGCNSSSSKNTRVIASCYDWIYDASWEHADSYHPNQNGQNTIAANMECCIAGGNPSTPNGFIENGQTESTLQAANFIRTGMICSGYFAITDTVADGVAAVSIPKGYTPGAWFGSYLQSTGAVSPMNIKDINSNYWGFAPAYGNANQMYACPTWKIEDTE